MKASRIKQLLPAIYQGAARNGSPLSALLEVMEDLHAPIEQTLNNIDLFFDPSRTPDAFVPFLAGWLDLEDLLDRPRSASGTRQPSLASGLGQLRALTASSVLLAKQRGTKGGLLAFLEAATGIPGYEIEEQPRNEQGTLIPFHLRITAPTASAAYKTLIERIIEREKPAHVTHELIFA